MNDILQPYRRITLDTDGSWVSPEENPMSVVDATDLKLQIKEDIKIDCEEIQNKIPQIKEIYYKKTSDEIKLFVFFDEIDFKTRGKIFDEIVKLQGKYNNYFDFKAFTMDFDRDVIEQGMEKLI